MSGVLACRIFGVCMDVRFQGLVLGFRKFGGQAWNSQRYPIFLGGQIIVFWTQGATTCRSLSLLMPRRECRGGSLY